MIDERGDKLVFLLGTPRSGSSLATVMLQNHRRIFAAQEMWFLMSLLDLKAAPRRAYGGGPILERFFNGVLPEEAFEDACRAFAVRAYNGLLAGGEADIVLDKSPRYYYALEFLDRLFPDAKRIGLVRNPFAVLASYKKLGAHRGEPFDAEAALTGSAFDIKGADLTIGLLRYERYFSAPNANAYRLAYEKLVADPQGELAGICRFLGTAYEDGMERYGASDASNASDAGRAAKADLYYSMGVGDPFVANHASPHGESVHAWKTALTKREIELYGRLLGSRLFVRLGYEAELTEAERLVGVRFGPEPDDELMARRTRQLAAATGCRWTENYAMRASGVWEPASEPEAAPSSPEAEAQRLRMTVRALELRLAHGIAEQRRLQAQLGAMKRKADWLKAAIPFGRRLSRIASSYLAGGARR